MFVVCLVSFHQVNLLSWELDALCGDATASEIVGEVVRPVISASLFLWNLLVRDLLLDNHN